MPVNFGFMPAAPGALGTSAIRATGAEFYYGAKDGSWPMPVPTASTTSAAAIASLAAGLEYSST